MIKDEKSKQGRTYYSIKNSAIASIAQLISVLLSFVTRTIFITKLGAEYLGVNGLFSNVLMMLSLAEMGVGTAIIYALYKPLAENDERTTSALMNLYGRLYKIIGTFILIVGLSIVPFLNNLIKDDASIPNLEVIYIIFLANSVISYFYAYKGSIILADQKGYINNLNTTYFLVAQNIVQIMIIAMTSNYYLYLITQFFFTFASNIVISIKADKLYSYLKKNKSEELDYMQKKNIYKNVLAMMSSKLGSVIVNGTDNLLISAFIGVYSVGLYSNYKLIVNTVKTLFSQTISAITASVGNLTAIENKQKAIGVYNKVYFINFFISFIGAASLFNLINPFVSIWIGSRYLLSSSIVAIIVVNFYIIQMRQPAQMFINTFGLFWHIKWKAIVEAIVNLIVSLFFVSTLKLGIVGILMGTFISNLATSVWWEPYVAFKYGLMLPVKSYYKSYLIDSVVCILNVWIIKLVISLNMYDGLMGFIVNIALTWFISLIVFVIVYGRRAEFKYCIGIANSVIKNKIAKFNSRV